MAHPSPRRRDTPPPKTGNTELRVLRGFLDYLRDSVAAKVEFAPEPGVRAEQVPSGTNLLGILNHLTFVESAVFLAQPVSNWSSTFRVDTPVSVVEVVDRYRSVVEKANAVIDTIADPSTALPHARAGSSGPSLRWALAHMIEETGRHAGHADILREIIDGSTGR